ncbi:MAG: SDR family NAD(P)-dependent oxidoreductase [Acidimicrobiia bacterium]
MGAPTHGPRGASGACDVAGTSPRRRGGVEVSSRLDGRRAIVTGGARGIGAAIATTFIREGASLALIDVLADEVAATAASIGASPYVVDLRDADATRTTMDAAIADLGGIDVLVNNAGMLRFTSFLDISADEWDEMFVVNVRSMLVTSQVAARSMIAAASGGKIVNMASMGGKVGSPNQSHYAASKAAVISLTRVAAMELGEHGITVNCICPGYVLTEMGAGTRTPEKVAEWSAKSPLGRLAQPQDVANAALFLASSDGDYLTGDALNVCGGMVMH